jgi:hypothetical protein
MRYLLIALLMTGCSLQPTINAIEGAAAQSARAAEDQNLVVLKFALCATPYSAIIRHPDIAPAILALCLPQGAAANPASVLTEIPAK